MNYLSKLSIAALFCAMTLISGETQKIALGSLADVVVGKMQFKEERKQVDSGKVKIKYVYSLTKK